MIRLDRFNNLDDLPRRLCVPNKANDVNVFNMTIYISSDCKYKFDGIK